MVPPRARHRLRPGCRTSRRAPGLLQVGLDDDRRLLLPDSAAAQRLLRLLAHGVDPARLRPQELVLFQRLLAAGVLVPVDDGEARSRMRAGARVAVMAPQPVHAAVRRMLAVAGLPEARSGTPPTARLLVTVGAEPRREVVDDSMQEDRPHLLVTEVAGRVRVGPCVVPGLTACLRCVDEHRTDRDPRHPLLVEQHLQPDPGDRAAEADRQLALAWAVRDLVALVEGDRPTSWSATIELRADGPVTRTWSRHPRCGCAWGDAVAG